jgi:hypothetical protein
MSNKKQAQACIEINTAKCLVLLSRDLYQFIVIVIIIIIATNNSCTNSINSY